MPSQERRLAGVIAYYVPSALVMLGLLVAWQLAVDLGGVKEYILPSPVAAIKTYFLPNYQWTANFLATLYATLGAFALSAVLGVALAVVIVWNALLMRTVMPVLVLFNTLPKIALAPLFVIWLGYGIWPNIVIGTTIAFFPMVVNTAVGLANAEPEMLELVRTLTASRWQVIREDPLPERGALHLHRPEAERHHERDRRHRRRVRRLRAGPGRAHHHRRRHAADAVDLRLADPDLGAGPRALRRRRRRRARGRALGLP